ncbi:AAA family ATPase [Arhodomonas sp. SL1]|uniref:ExeA family protein n=1 Tax=Arhodomonas sp. SL1 TaxID=3425691 RepID=UPI003F883D58
MYHRFFGLEHDPFRLTPSAEVVFRHPSFERARAYLEYGLMGGEGFVVVTGPPGCGKTTLIAQLCANLPAGTDVAQIVTSRLGAEDLLRLTASVFGIEPGRRDKAALLTALQRDLEQRSERGRRALLVVDEAQDLEPDALEELRLLTNLTRQGQPLLQIVLLGQPPLRELLKRPEMEQFRQRLIASCQLEPLTEAQTRKYVHYRLEGAGWDGDPAISEAVFRLLHVASGGVPRRINLLGGRLLLDAFADSRHEVHVEHLHRVLAEMEDEAADAVTERGETGTPPLHAPRAEPEPPTESADGPAPPSVEPDPFASPRPRPERDSEPPGPGYGKEPVLTDVVTPGAGSRPPRAGPASPQPTAQPPKRAPRQRHTTAMLATILAIVALVIVIAAATPAFDGLHEWAMAWYRRLVARL